MVFEVISFQLYQRIIVSFDFFQSHCLARGSNNNSIPLFIFSLLTKSFNFFLNLIYLLFSRYSASFICIGHRTQYFPANDSLVVTAAPLFPLFFYNLNKNYLVTFNDLLNTVFSVKHYRLVFFSIFLLGFFFFFILFEGDPLLVYN